MGNAHKKPRVVSEYNLDDRRVRLEGGPAALSQRVRDGDRLNVTLHFRRLRSSPDGDAVLVRAGLVPRLQRYFESARFVEDLGDIFFRQTPSGWLHSEYGLDVDEPALDALSWRVLPKTRARVRAGHVTWAVSFPLVLQLAPKPGHEAPLLPDAVAFLAASADWHFFHGSIPVLGPSYLPADEIADVTAMTFAKTS